MILPILSPNQVAAMSSNDQEQKQDTASITNEVVQTPQAVEQAILGATSKEYEDQQHYLQGVRLYLIMVS